MVNCSSTKVSWTHIRQRIVSSINVIGKGKYPHAEEWNWTLILTSYTKISSTSIKNLNVRPESVKLVQENIGKNLHDLGLSNGFFKYIPKAPSTKANTDKWDCTILKTSAEKRKHQQSEEITSRMWENIYKPYIWQGVSKKMYKELK